LPPRASAAGIPLVPATGLELGGKDPAYVRPDCDLDYTVEQLVDGSFFNSGQCCCAIERIYVHESIYDTFVDKFVALTKVRGGAAVSTTGRVHVVHSAPASLCLLAGCWGAQQYRLGNPLEPTTNLGPMVKASAADAVRKQIADAGADRCLCGGAGLAACLLMGHPASARRVWRGQWPRAPSP